MERLLWRPTRTGSSICEVIMQEFVLLFYRYGKKDDKRLSVAMRVEAYNEDSADTIASAICDNMPGNWTYGVQPWASYRPDVPYTPNKV